MRTTRNKRGIRTALSAVAGVAMFGVYGAPGADADSESAIRIGGDVRWRQETMNEIESPSKIVDDNYLRMRTRFWIESDMGEHVTARVRVMNEFRHWLRPDQDGVSGSANYEWPDELVFDNVYVDLHGLWNDTLSLRAGRQDFMVDGTDKPLFGRGRVLYDGTGEDGSRSRSFNAIRASWKASQKTTLDAFGIYMPSEDEWAIGSADRDLTGYTSACDDMTQAGGGVYLKNSSFSRCPIETYGIYKHEDTWTQAAKKDSSGAWKSPSCAWQTLNEEQGLIENPEYDQVTVGLVLAPETAAGTKASLEVASQFGERGDIEARGYMVDAVVSHSFPFWKAVKPTLEAEFYYLSGDDPTTKEDEGWDPVWARYTQHSDILSRTFFRSRWTNVTMPMLYASVNPTRRSCATVGASYVTAPENDGAGTGRDRGWWYYAKMEYKVAESMLRKGDRLNCRVILEVLDPGDYYASTDTAHYLQWQVVYGF